MSQTPRPSAPAEHDSPRNMLEYMDRAVRPQTDDEFLGENNVGTGNYDRREFYQQLETFGDYMYAEAALEEPLLRRAEEKARREAAREGFDPDGDTEVVAYDESSETELSFEEHADEQWEALSVPARLQVIRKFTTYDPGRRPAPGREFQARHELSRSKDGWLLNKAMTDRREVREVEQTGPSQG